MIKFGSKAIAIALLVSIRAECLPESRFLFLPPPSAGSIRKMQIDINQISGRWTVEVRSLRKDGKIFAGHLGCTKLSENELICRRPDGGGEFNLITRPTPKLTLKFFCADQEGDDVRTFVSGPKGDSIAITGEKAIISSKDLF